MQPYRDLHGDSGIEAFDLGDDWIDVRFKHGGTYRYDQRSPGRERVREMQQLALSGDGLNTFINRHVRDLYACKLS